jgi:hypothetical protein
MEEGRREWWALSPTRHEELRGVITFDAPGDLGESMTIDRT